MKLKNIIAIIMFILIIEVASAINLRPEIEVTFDEVIDESTININLTNQSGALFDLDKIESKSNNPKFVYQPTLDLSEGFYTIRAQAKDLQGTLGPMIELVFLIQIPPLEITLIEPNLGVSPTDSFDFIIETDRWAVCRYSFLDQSYDNMTVIFNTDNNLLHKKTDFSKTGAIYVKCRDEYEKIVAKSYTLSVDSSSPEIVYKYADDVTEFPINTILTIRTNEDTVCRFYMEDSKIVYGGMEPFPDYDEADENSYKTEHQQILNGNELKDKKANRCYLRCKNKAGLLSAMEYIDINVDTTSSPTITINDPKRYITDTTPLFNVTTNKDSTCSISNNSGMSNAIGMAGTEKYHTKELANALTSGAYTYYVECIFAVEGKKQTSVTFSIDSTPPSMKYVNIKSPLTNRTDKTYKDDELCAEWKAEDNESSISSYYYYIYWDKSSDELIEEGTKSPDSDNEYCIDVSLNDSQSYYIMVNAQNSVGLWSDNKTSSSIQVDISLAPVGCDNNKKDGDETDIDCGGNCEGCVNGKNCLLNSDCSSTYCNSSNKCASPSCNDDVKNGAETDVDCGGDKCKGCEVGDSCNKNKDCKTNNCDVSTGKCAAVLDKCENNKLDVGETDIDCGGDCPLCDAGKKCNSDSDCISSAECKDGICILRQLDSDGDGIVDDKDNCPDTANEDQADVDNDNIGDMCDSDSDNDKLPDTFEQQYFDCVTCANPDDDPDKDGLTNLDEYTYNTNPTKRDTDGDGYSDKEEIDKKTDPLDPSSHPRKGLLKYFLIALLFGALGGGFYFGYKILVRKKYVPLAPIAKKAPMPLPRRQIRPPMPRPPMIRAAPIKPEIKRAETAKKEIKIEKPSEKKEEENVFKKLSEISKSERVGKIEKNIKQIDLTDTELKERIDKLKKELKVK